MPLTGAMASSLSTSNRLCAAAEDDAAIHQAHTAAVPAAFSVATYLDTAVPHECAVQTGRLRERVLLDDTQGAGHANKCHRLPRGLGRDAPGRTRRRVAVALFLDIAAVARRLCRRRRHSGPSLRRL